MVDTLNEIRQDLKRSDRQLYPSCTSIRERSSITSASLEGGEGGLTEIADAVKPISCGVGYHLISRKGTAAQDYFSLTNA